MMRESGLRHSSSTTNHRLFGLVLGTAGAILDFYSAFLLLTQSGTGMSGMEKVAVHSGTGLVSGIGIAALGIILGATAVSYVVPSGILSMKDFGALMIVYGGGMLFIGVLMYSGITSMAQGTIFPAFGMLVIGALMFANGVIMRRSGPMFQ
jgi:hypothetical protein